MNTARCKAELTLSGSVSKRLQSRSRCYRKSFYFKFFNLYQIP